MALKLFVGNKYPTFEFTIKDEDGDVVDLSNPDVTTAKCYIRKQDATANKFSGDDCNTTIQDKATGRIDYTLPDNGINEAGTYTAQILLNYTAGGEQETERFQFPVEQGLKPTS